MKRLKPYLTNFYLMAGVAFVVWMLFFDQNNASAQWKRIQERSSLEKDRDFYLSQTGKVREELDALRESPVLLEAFAREAYLMHKPGEEVYYLSEE